MRMRSFGGNCSGGSGKKHWRTRRKKLLYTNKDSSACGTENYWMACDEFVARKSSPQCRPKKEKNEANRLLPWKENCQRRSFEHLHEEDIYVNFIEGTKIWKCAGQCHENPEMCWPMPFEIKHNWESNTQTSPCICCEGSFSSQNELCTSQIWLTFHVKTNA